MADKVYSYTPLEGESQDDYYDRVIDESFLAMGWIDDTNTNTRREAQQNE